MDYQQLIREKHIWVIRLRFVLSFVLAGSYILKVPVDSILDLSLSWPMLALAAIILIIVSANFIWLRLLKRNEVPLESIGYYQCIFDLLVVTLLVHQYGARGLFAYLYVLVILISGVLLQRKGIILIAAMSSVLFLLLLLMEHFGYTVPLPPVLGGVGLLPANVQFLIDICIKGFFFYLVAISCANMQDMLQKAAKESEFMANFNQGIVDMVPIGIMVIDAGRNIAMYNPMMAQTTQIEAADALGKTLTETFKGIDDTWETALSQVESTGEEVRLLGTLIPASGGRSIRCNVRFQPLKIGDQVLGSVCLVQTAAR
ncbi:MAG: PAS domain-containing protein [Candidatus Hydrogenedentota bacterium]